MKKRRLWILIAAALLIVSGFGVNWYLRSGNGARDAVQAQTRIIRATRGDLNVTISATGVTAPKTKLSVWPRVGGIVSQVNVEEGDTISAGDVIAVLDQSEYKLKVAQMQDSLIIAETKLAQAEANLVLQKKQTEAQVEQAQASVASAKAKLAQLLAGPKPQEVEQARSALRQAEVNWETAETDRKRLEGLLAKGAISKQQYEAAEAKAASAEEQVRTAREKLELLLAGADQEDIDAARAQVQQAEASLNLAIANRDQIRVKEEEVNSAQAQVRQAKANLELAEAQLKDTVIKAPIDGIITSLPVEVGDSVTANSLIASVANTDVMVVRTFVDEVDIAKVQPGALTRTTVDALEGQFFTGRVTKIAPEANVKDNIVSFEVTSEIPNPGQTLKSGLTADVEIVVNSKENVLLVPNQAIKIVGRQKVVTVMEGEEQVTRIIETGISDGIRTEILSGLQEMEPVVVAVSTGGSGFQPPQAPPMGLTPGSFGGGGFGGGGFGGGGFGGAAR